MNENKCLLLIVKIDLNDSPFPILSFKTYQWGDLKEKKKNGVKQACIFLYKLFQKIENFQPKKALHNYDM